MFEELADAMNHVKTLETSIAGKETEYEDLAKVHKQERAQEVQEDK